MAKKPIPQSKWQRLGVASHFIRGNECRFHMATIIGGHLVSTVGAYQAPGGYAREGDKDGNSEIGFGRTFETMVFRTQGMQECGCHPAINPSELDFDGYKTAVDAQAGHMAMCRKWARRGSP